MLSSKLSNQEFKCLARGHNGRLKGDPDTPQPSAWGVNFTALPLVTCRHQENLNIKVFVDVRVKIIQRVHSEGTLTTSLIN